VLNTFALIITQIHEEHLMASGRLTFGIRTKEALIKLGGSASDTLLHGRGNIHSHRIAAIDYALIYPYPINPITKLVLEGICFLTVRTVSLRAFRVVERGGLELLEKALPNQLEKILNMIEGFITRGTSLQRDLRSRRSGDKANVTNEEAILNISLWWKITMFPKALFFPETGLRWNL